MLTIKQNIKLANLTSFKVGGLAQQLLTVTSAKDFREALPHIDWSQPYWLLGSGSNILISDQGLSGLTIRFKQGIITYHQSDNCLIADAGVQWDKLVRFSIKKQLWGIELMSGIPGTVAGAVAININAYGQALADVLDWIEIYNPQTNQLTKETFRAKDWAYKQSPYSGGKLVIVRASLKLSPQPTTALTYTTALKYAQTQKLNPNLLANRRQIIMAVRAEAGSLLNNTSVGKAKTCGSFFRNPIVNQQQIKTLLSYDESGLGIDQLLKMNQIHGGQNNRISAAHVLLAAGFQRGQTFGRVRLHPSHVLKLENYNQASAREIYQVAREIQATVKQKLQIDLEFEVNTLGEF